MNPASAFIALNLMLSPVSYTYDCSSTGACGYYVAQDGSQYYVPEDQIIYYNMETQKNQVYDAPASLVMTLDAIGYDVSQEYMASLLGTDWGNYAGGQHVADALNTVAAGSPYYFYWSDHVWNDVETMRDRIVSSIAWGNPVVVETVEYPGEFYIAGHESLGWPCVVSFGVVGDYFDYGAYVTYTDPGAGFFPGFQQDQLLSMEELSYAAGLGGYAW